MDRGKYFQIFFDVLFCRAEESEENEDNQGQKVIKRVPILKEVNNSSIKKNEEKEEPIITDPLEKVSEENEGENDISNGLFFTADTVPPENDVQEVVVSETNEINGDLLPSDSENDNITKSSSNPMLENKNKKVDENEKGPVIDQRRKNDEEEETEGEDEDDKNPEDELFKDLMKVRNPMSEKDLQKFKCGIQAPLHILGESSFDESKDKEEIEVLQKTGLANLEFKHLIDLSFMARGSYGAVFLCKIAVEGQPNLWQMVVKFIFEEVGGEKSQESMFLRDALYPGYHKNIMQVVYSDPNFKVNNYVLTDDSIVGCGKQLNHATFGDGIIVMKHFPCTLQFYLRSRVLVGMYLKDVEVCRIMKGILDGVHYLNQKKICHLDLHTQNIFMDTNYKYSRIVIGDFGSSLSFSQRKGALGEDMTVTIRDKDWGKFVALQTSSVGFNSSFNFGDLGGKSVFLSPEIRGFDAEVDEKLDYSESDMYSIGVTGLLLLKFQNPRWRTHAEESRRKSLKELFERMKTDRLGRIKFSEAVPRMNEILGDCDKKFRPRIDDTSVVNTKLFEREEDEPAKKETQSVLSRFWSKKETKDVVKIDRKELERLKELEKRVNEEEVLVKIVNIMSKEKEALWSGVIGISQELHKSEHRNERIAENENEKKPNMVSQDEIEKIKRNLPPTLFLLSEDSFDISRAKKECEELRTFGFKGPKGLKFNHITFRSFIARGAYGACYLCQIPVKIKGEGEHLYSKSRLMVAKFLFKSCDSENISDLMFSRDSLQISFHKNIANVVHYDPQFEVDNFTLLSEKMVGDHLGKNLDPEKDPMFREGIILMKYYPLTLQQFLLQRKINKMYLENIEICRIMKGLLDGVQFLHEKKICHRDLHTSNIFIEVTDEYSRVIIGDFGCSIDFSARSGDITRDKGMEIKKSDDDWTEFISIGTSYSEYLQLGGNETLLAPEISEFDYDVDSKLDYSRCDMYALGLTGLEVITFQTDEARSKGKKFEREALKKLFLEMAEKNPFERIDFEKCQERLDRILRGSDN